jgi:hypothetical protein
MKAIALLTLAVLALASGCASDDTTAASLSQNRLRYEKTTGALMLGRIDARDETHESVFARVQTIARQNDPSGIGVEIVVPKQYRRRYNSDLKDKRVTITLGPQLTMKQFIAEFPTDDWFLCYAGEGVLRLVPLDSVRE